MGWHATMVRSFKIFTRLLVTAIYISHVFRVKKSHLIKHIFSEKYYFFKVRIGLCVKCKIGSNHVESVGSTDSTRDWHPKPTSSFKTTTCNSGDDIINFSWRASTITIGKFHFLWNVFWDNVLTHFIILYLLTIEKIRQLDPFGYGTRIYSSNKWIVREISERVKRLLTGPRCLNVNCQRF